MKTSTNPILLLWNDHQNNADWIVSQCGLGMRKDYRVPHRLGFQVSEQERVVLTRGSHLQLSMQLTARSRAQGKLAHRQVQVHQKIFFLTNRRLFCCFH